MENNSITNEEKICEQRDGTEVNRPIRKLMTVLKSRKAEGYIDVAVMIIAVMMVLALSVRVIPVFITKIQLDNFADELVREAEVSGRVGYETSERYTRLAEKTGIYPTATWSVTGNIQLNHEVTVTLTINKDIGLFGDFASFPVTLKSSATGKSEVYWR